MKSPKQLCVAIALTALSGTAWAQVTANVTVTNNYIWRGLTQTTNDAAVQGGIDYAHATGLYVGTWVSNVKYAAGDAFSYEHDVYFGYAGGDKLTYDIGWIYYNYDDEARFDFHELYAALGGWGFDLKGYVLTGTEADEPSPDRDYGFGAGYYLSADYAYEFSNGFSIGAHVGRHTGDFNEGFNVVPGDYWDYNLNFNLGGFTFLINDTDLTEPGPDGLDNDSVKFVISYTWNFDVND